MLIILARQNGPMSIDEIETAVGVDPGGTITGLVADDVSPGTLYAPGAAPVGSRSVPSAIRSR